MTVIETPVPVVEAATRDALWRTVFLLAASAALGGVLGAITLNKQLFLYKEVLGLKASGVGTLLLLINIPAYLQPFMSASPIYSPFSAGTGALISHWRRGYNRSVTSG